MEEINRLHDIADDLDRTMWGHELADALHNIAAGIGEEVDRISELRRERDKLRDEAAWAESLSEILDEWADLLGFPEQKGDPGKITARVGAVLDGTWRRLMPEGCEWPRYEDGEPVPLGGEVTVTVHDKDGDFDRTFAIRSIKYKESGVLLEGTKNEMVILSYGKRVKRPAPPVLDADGVEVHKGDDVWSTTGEFDGKRTVSSVHIDPDEPPYAMFEELKKPYSCLCCHLTHQRPVFDADDAPIKKGDTVWHKGTGEKYRVFRFSAIENRVWGENDFGSFLLDCSMLTNTKPEPSDSWEKWSEDFIKPPCVYCRDILGVEFDDDTELDKAFDARNQDMECRARALAERGE